MKSKGKNYLSLTDSALLQGFAILLMVFHHCFCIPARLNYNYVPVLFGFATEARIAYIGKICVAIYAFITGYALSKKNNPCYGVIARFAYDVKTSVKTLIKFYSKFWMVCLVFIPMGILFYHQSPSPFSILRAFFWGEGYNGEWWYVFQYIKLLLFFPFLNTFLYCLNRKKTRKFAIALMLLGAAFFVYVLLSGNRCFFIRCSIRLYRFFISTYLIIFICAYLIGVYGIYEYIYSKITISHVFYSGIILILVLIRWFAVSGPADGRIDIFITPILIYCLVALFHDTSCNNTVQRILICFGHYSTFIWLIHTFWIYYFFQSIILLPRYSVLIYFWALVLSLGNAWVFDFIYRRLRIETLVNKIPLIQDSIGNTDAPAE